MTALQHEPLAQNATVHSQKEKKKVGRLHSKRLQYDETLVESNAVLMAPMPPHAEPGNTFRAERFRQGYALCMLNLKTRRLECRHHQT